MGIIILPFVVAAAAVCIISIRKAIILYREGKMSHKDIYTGAGISFFLYISIAVSYIMEGKAWVLSPFFRLPFFMIFVPFVMYLLFDTAKNERLKHFSKIILISISLTGILGVLFNNLFFGMVDYLGIEKYH